MLALYFLPSLFWFLFLICSQGWVQPPQQMFILNIYITCIFWGRRGRKLPPKALQGAAFCLVTFFPSFLPVSCSFAALPEKDLSALRASCDTNSLKYVIISQEGASSLHVDWQLLAHILHCSSLLCQPKDSRHSLNSDHALTLHQIGEQQGAVAQHWLLCWPDETSKGFQHRRDTSCRSWHTKGDFPSPSSSAKIINSQIWNLG